MSSLKQRVVVSSQFVIAALIAILSGWGIYALLSDWGYDDPYITYRYAENLYAGRGFVYNPGEQILSTTSPLFTLILAGLRFFWNDLPRAANLIGAASLVLGSLYLWDIARQWNEPLAGWAALILYPTYSLLVQTLGSETPLYLALCLGAIALYLRNRLVSAAILLALAVLTRGDAAILVVILSVDWLLKHPVKSIRNFQTLPWKAIAAGSAILLAWTLFALPYFGSPLPITISIKRAQGLMEISELFAPGFLRVLRPYFGKFNFWIELILMGFGLVYAILRARPWLLLVNWSLFYFLSYTALGVTRYFWYYAPLIPAFVAMMGLGLSVVQRIPFPARAGPRTLSWVAMLTLAGLAVSQIISLNLLSEKADARLIPYRLVGEWFTQNTLPNTTIGTLEVGVIGYYAAPRGMVDFAGLIQPEVAKLFAPESTYQNAAIWAIGKYKPHYLVIHNGLFPQLEETLVATHCTPVKEFAGEETGYSQDLVIYKCHYP